MGKFGHDVDSSSLDDSEEEDRKNQNLLEQQRQRDALPKEGKTLWHDVFEFQFSTSSAVSTTAVQFSHPDTTHSGGCSLEFPRGSCTQFQSRYQCFTSALFARLGKSTFPKRAHISVLHKLLRFRRGSNEGYIIPTARGSAFEGALTLGWYNMDENRKTLLQKLDKEREKEK